MATTSGISFPSSSAKTIQCAGMVKDYPLSAGNYIEIIITDNPKQKSTQDQEYRRPQKKNEYETSFLGREDTMHPVIQKKTPIIWKRMSGKQVHVDRTARLLRNYSGHCLDLSYTDKNEGLGPSLRELFQFPARIRFSAQNAL